MTTLALDWDNTITREPHFCGEIVEAAQRHGIVVIVVTNRGPDWPIDGCLLPVVYAAGKPKRDAARNAGYSVDLWLDDSPHLVDLGEGHPVAQALGLP